MLLKKKWEDIHCKFVKYNSILKVSDKTCCLKRLSRYLRYSSNIL